MTGGAVDENGGVPGGRPLFLEKGRGCGVGTPSPQGPPVGGRDAAAPNVKGNDGRSALKLAVQQGYSNIVKILTEAGATQ